MGFFRFRRSIKIAPGIRWNFGKKSTSLSFGPRGAHYTVGTAGTRTTVGIPGTGLSYSEIQRSHSRITENADYGNIPAPDPTWVASQQSTATLHVPDRGKEEPPIRADQIEILNSLGHAGISADYDPKSLGSDQAASVILQLKEAQKEYSKTVLKKYYADHGHAESDGFIDHACDHPDQPYAEPKKGMGWGTILGLCFLLWVVVKVIESWLK